MKGFQLVSKTLVKNSSMMKINNMKFHEAFVLAHFNLTEKTYSEIFLVSDSK